MPLVRFLAVLAEWVVYDALGSLSRVCVDTFDDGGGDPFT